MVELKDLFVRICSFLGELYISFPNHTVGEEWLGLGFFYFIRI